VVGLIESVLPRQKVSIRRINRDPDSWCGQVIDTDPFPVSKPLADRLIQRRIKQTEALGEYALWEGYGQPGATRDAKAVSVKRNIGCFYAWLVRAKTPSVIVGFGSAFGVSGMYWLAGIEETGVGELLSFEVNLEWATVARANMDAISDRFYLTVGTFEDHIAARLNGRKIDIALIDAIHTSEFVGKQFEIVMSHLRPQGIVLLDDIDFSPDMADCWTRLAHDPRVGSSFEVEGHVGVLEMR